MQRTVSVARRGAVVVTSASVLLMGMGVVNGTAVAHGPVAAPVTGDWKVDQLLSRMTLDEKLSMIEGQAEAVTSSSQYQAGYLPGVPRLGIPSLKLTDGPPGVITKQDSTGMTATMGVAATFSKDDAKANGGVIGSDARALGQDVVLEPFVNLDRDTSWGRSFNTFGEDPLLSGQTGASEITGIQNQGVMAMVKHYIAYDGSNNVSVDSQTLHEIYLQPFADAIDAGVSSIMCSYNVVNSTQACGNSETLTNILRNELGFKGFVTSDWGANHSTLYLNAGLDMEMPGGGTPTSPGIASFFDKASLKQAVANGSIQLSRVNEAVGRILYEYDQFGLLSGQSKHNITPENRNKDAKVVQKTGTDAATLLQNQGSTLPLSSSALSSLALIGPGAGQTIATNGGGEKSGGIASRQIGTYQALKTDLAGKPGVNLSFAVADDMTGTPVPASALSHGGTPGLLRTDTATNATQVDGQLNFTKSNSSSLPVGAATKWTGTLTATEAGSYWLNIQALGATANLTVDGKSLQTVGGSFLGPSARYGAVHATDGNGPLPTTDGLANGRTQITLAAGDHSLSVTETPDASGAPVQVRLNWVTPSQATANHDAAVTAAKNANTAVVFAWSSGDLSQPLPEGQDQLIADIAAVNPHTVVVLNSSNPVAMPWLSSVKSVLEMWYPGDEGGWSTADILLGRANPGGRLPFTWPATLSQEPSHKPGDLSVTSTGVAADGTQNCGGGAFGGPVNTTCLTTYKEGVNVGYRYYAANNLTPLYPFGYGLSYTSFAYSNLGVTTAHDGGLNVQFTVSNTGLAAGDTVPQIYLGAPTTKPSGAQFAPIALAAYDRVQISGGHSKMVSVHVPKRQLEYWSTTGGWTVATGNRTVSVGTSAATLVLNQVVTITG